MEQNIRNVNILLTCADNRNDNETSTFMDGVPSNRGRGPDLTACLVGLRSHSQSHQGRCLTRTVPKYVGSLVFTEFLLMNVGYTNSFSILFFVNTYDTVHRGDQTGWEKNPVKNLTLTVLVQCSLFIAFLDRSQCPAHFPSVFFEFL